MYIDASRYAMEEGSGSLTREQTAAGRPHGELSVVSPGYIRSILYWGRIVWIANVESIAPSMATQDGWRAGRLTGKSICEDAARYHW